MQNLLGMSCITQQILQQQQQMAGLTVHGSQFICIVHEAFFEADRSRVMMAMELADRTLLSDIRRYQMFSDDEARVVMKGLLQALQWLGHCQVCHNDIKLGNILLLKPPLGHSFRWQVKLSDFGSSSSTQWPRNRMLTTYKYAVPELLWAAESAVHAFHTHVPVTSGQVASSCASSCQKMLAAMQCLRQIIRRYPKKKGCWQV